MNRFQLKLIDLFWATGLVACVVGAVTTSQAEIAFIGLSCVLLFVWHRPVLLRFWTVTVVGIGAALFFIGYKDGYEFRMPSANLMGWGAGLMIGGGMSFWVFDVRKPPATG